MEVWAIRILSLKHDYEEITLSRQWKNKLKQRTVRNLPAKEDLYLRLSFYDTYIYYYMYKYTSLVRQHGTNKYPSLYEWQSPSKTIQTLLSTPWNRYYPSPGIISISSCLIVCWWIAAVTGLDTGLTIHIDKFYERSQIGQQTSLITEDTHFREISSTPRDIARTTSQDPGLRIIEEEFLATSARDK
jgi:hypothetical protein